MSPVESGFDEYHPLGRRALLARAALAAMVAVDLVAVFSGLAEYSLLVRLETEDVPVDELDASDRRQLVVAVVQTIVFAFGAFFFVRWLHHAYRNLRPLGAGALRYSTHTAVWSWFVPILNLWKPKQVINDVWRASDPDAPRHQNLEDWSAKDPPLLYGFWWLFFIVLNFVYNAALRLDLRAEELEELQLASLVTIVADGLSVAGALLALAVVRQTTRRQEARAEGVRTDIVAPPE
jgi:uncharacterized protein DUF4328